MATLRHKKVHKKYIATVSTVKLVFYLFTEKTRRKRLGKHCRYCRCIVTQDIFERKKLLETAKSEKSAKIYYQNVRNSHLRCRLRYCDPQKTALL